MRSRPRLAVTGRGGPGSGCRRRRMTEPRRAVALVRELCERQRGTAAACRAPSLARSASRSGPSLATAAPVSCELASSTFCCAAEMRSRFAFAACDLLVELLALDLQVLLRAHEVGDELFVVAGRDRAVLGPHTELVHRLDVRVRAAARSGPVRPGRARAPRAATRSLNCCCCASAEARCRFASATAACELWYSRTAPLYARPARRSGRRWTGSLVRAARLRPSCRRSSSRPRAMGSARRSTIIAVDDDHAVHADCGSRLPPLPSKSRGTRATNEDRRGATGARVDKAERRNHGGVRVRGGCVTCQKWSRNAVDQGLFGLPL